MKKVLFIGIALLFVFGCAGRYTEKETMKPVTSKHELTINVVTEDGQAKKIQIKEGERVIKSMEIRKPGFKLSSISAIYGDKLYIKMFSGLSVADVTRAWSDMLVASEEYGFTEGSEVHLFIDSPGGDAFSGLALADLIEYYKGRGWKFIAHGTGIIASAAVPIFAVCNETHATAATIFMVHEAALWKWPGRETASDIRSQGRLMDLLQLLYLQKLVDNSNLDLDEWKLLEARTSWFGVELAVKMGILDYID
jgi:ATP-dependent protease ClpP protease subunit